MLSILQISPITFTTLCLAPAVLLLINFFRNHGRILSAAVWMPSVLPPLPWVLCKLALHGVDGMGMYSFNRLRKLIEKGVRGCVLWLGPYPLFLVCKPDDIQVVVNNELDVGPDLELMREFVGNGLIACPLDIWRVTRRHIQPLYHPRNIQFLVPALNKIGRDTVFRLSRHVGCGTFDIKDDMGKTALQSACCVTFGPSVNVNIKESTMREMLKAMNRAAQLTAIRTTKIWLRSDFIYKILYKEDRTRICSIMNTFFKEIYEINEKLEVNTKKSPKCETNGVKPNLITEEAKGHITLFDSFRVLQENLPNFTDADLQNEATSTLAAAIETSEITLSSCLLALAANPKIQEKLYDEIVSVVGPEDRDITYEDLKHLPYLDYVVKETLRKFPILPMVSRRTHRDLKLSFGTIPAGAFLSLALMGVHYDPNNYPDPEKFDPDRFLPENVAQRHKYTHLPFLAGPRNCIGKVFAMTSLKIELALIIKKYSFETNVDIDKLSFVSGIVCRSKNGYKMKIENRK